MLSLLILFFQDVNHDPDYLNKSTETPLPPSMVFFLKEGQEPWIEDLKEKYPEVLSQALQRTDKTFEVFQITPSKILDVLQGQMSRIAKGAISVVLISMVSQAAMFQMLPNNQAQLGSVSGLVQLFGAGSVLVQMFSGTDLAFFKYAIATVFFGQVEPWSQVSLEQAGISGQNACLIVTAYMVSLKLESMMLLDTRNADMLRVSFVPELVHNTIFRGLVSTYYMPILTRSGILPTSRYDSSPEGNAKLLQAFRKLPWQVKKFSPEEILSIKASLQKTLGDQKWSLLKEFVSEALKPSGRRNNVYFIGGVGTGKTYTADMLGASMKLPVAHIGWETLLPPRERREGNVSIPLLEALSTTMEENGAAVGYKNMILVLDEGDHFLQSEVSHNENLAKVNQFLSEKFLVNSDLNFPIPIQHINVIITGNREPLADLKLDDVRRQALLSRANIVHFSPLSEKDRQSIAWNHFAKQQAKRLGLSLDEKDKFFLVDVIVPLDGFLEVGVRGLAGLVSQYLRLKEEWPEDTSLEEAKSLFLESEMFRSLKGKLQTYFQDPSGRVLDENVKPLEEHFSALFGEPVSFSPGKVQEVWTSSIKNAKKPAFWD